MSSLSIFALRRVLFITIGLLLATGISRTQIVGGSIHGEIHDASGGLISGAEVTVRNQETGAARLLHTDDSGRYAAPSVPVGRYEVVVHKDGFGTQTRTDIVLAVGQSIAIDLTLNVAEVEQKIVVTDAQSAVNLSTQQVSGLVDERQVKELPLNGRSYDQLMTLNPATVNYTSQRSGAIGTSNSSVGNMFSVSGKRPQDNLFLLNGIEYTGASLINVTPGGTSGQLLGVEAVREFNVVTDDYGAANGKRSGAQVSIVTASGTNNLHGSVYEYLRNSALDARNYFDQGSVPNFQRNQFGATLGGPIRKDKFFLFGNYEGFRQNLALSDVTFVPDNASRAAAAPSVAPLLALWPVQNGPELGGGIATSYSHPLQRIREDFGTARFDANLGSRDQLAAIYTVDDSNAHTPTANPLSLIDETLREQVLSLQEQHVITPALLNTARVGYSRASYFFTGSVPVDVPGWVLGKPIGAIVISGSTASNGASQITLAGSNVGSNNATTRNLFTYDDHVYYTRGRHQIEAGLWFQQIQANDNLAQNQYGQASFSTLAKFLQGNIATFTVVPSPTALNWRSLEGAGFVEDTVKVTPHLELRAGIRFESTNGWNEAHGRASNYAITNGVLQTNPRIGGSALTTNRAIFLPEPRIGFSWDVFGNGKTAVHGGFGVYRALLDNLDYRLDQTAPFNTTLSLKNISVSGLQITPGITAPSGSLVSPSNVQPDIFTPTVLSWTFKVEQQLVPSTSVTFGYIGSHSYHQILSLDMNEPVPTILSDGTPFYPPNSPFANPQLANTTSWASKGVGLYNALTIDVRRRLANGLAVRGSYTYSKNLDDGSAWNTSVSGNTPAFVSFPLNPKEDWGPAATDIRHLVAANATYDLPFGRQKHFFANQNRWVEHAISGWTASAIVNLQSGFPFSPQLGYNPTGNGDTRNPVRPSWNTSFSGKLYPRTTSQYFNPAAFVTPAAGFYGNVRRDSLVGPGLGNLDFSLLKDTSLSDRVRLEFRAEFFNVLNHTNFTTPNPVVFSAANTVSPTAGAISATATTSRQIQFAAKVKF
jgi:Carboxypeptidase regulatory-like domain